MECEFETHPDGSCEGEIKVRKAMTAYHFEGVRNSKEDPNRDFLACELHHGWYVDYWSEMWAEYYRNIR